MKAMHLKKKKKWHLKKRSSGGLSKCTETKGLQMLLHKWDLMRNFKSLQERKSRTIVRDREIKV